MMTTKLSARRNIPVKFLDAEFQELLIRHLYQELARYTELNVRHAIRLDHGTSGDAEDGTPHPMMNGLSSDDGRDSLSYLMAAEDTLALHLDEDDHPSLAAAWLRLLCKYGNQSWDSPHLARHQNVSVHFEDINFSVLNLQVMRFASSSSMRRRM